MGKKKWWQSKGVWGGFIGFLLGGVSLVDQHFGTDLSGSNIYEWVLQGAIALGLYGRLKAKSEID